MQLQRNSPDSPDQERNGFAALRQKYPEPDIRNGLKGRNPNQSFAAGEFDVSVADFAVIQFHIWMAAFGLIVALNGVEIHRAILGADNLATPNLQFFDT